jgi:single-stranded DNA-specific DHH superfamily exonuclease
MRELLTEFNFEQAQQFASEIEQYNSDRKDLDKQITKEAFLNCKAEELNPIFDCCFSGRLAKTFWNCRF